MKYFFKKCCRKKKPEMKPGAILDQVISQSTSSANKCLLYKLANYKRGGDLIDALQTGGQIAVEQLIREQFGVFMYNNGKGQIINRAEFLRWKYRDNHEVVIPIEASLSQHDPLGKWVDHKACWQMQYRGSLGESLLHVLIICDTKIHTKLARLLLRVFPALALDVMEGEEYLGASALHLAIAYSNNELVADLVEAGAEVNQRAIGSFFLPRDQQRSRPAKNTDYEGLAYLGEYPLAWAACCANESVYNLLMDNEADPDLQDSFGNMILHMVVVCDKLDMFGYALRHPKTPARNGIVNKSGLTPLTLACKLGRAEVFREMLELSSREFWRYSNITCSGYPLNALDTLLPDGRTNWNSALFIILNGTKEEHLDMLDGGIIQRLLEEKWKTFARNQFLKRLMILFIHLFCLSISVYLRPVSENMQARENGDNGDKKATILENNGETNKDGEEEETDVKTIIRYCCELATIAGVLSYVIFQQGDEVKNQGLSAFLKQLSHAPAKAIFLVSNLMILACIPFRLMGDIDTEEAILLFAVPGSWFLLMFFAGAVRLTGPFVTMIYSMLTGDMFTFGIIYTIVLFGFSQAFYFLYKGHSQVQTTLFNTYPSTWMALFQTTLGDYNYPELNQTSYPNLAKTVFVIFMIFVPILLLNMLIAMMGNTYAHVIEQSEKEWMKQWAKIVVTLERAVPSTDAQKYLEQYSIPLGPSDDSGFEQRGVMVIKSKSKTRAKQRKGAVCNWKRVGKVTLNELKKRGMTGEELRRIMWGRASITSPTKVSKKKPVDPYNILGTTGALGAATDAMTYTQDIVITTDTVTQPNLFFNGQTPAATGTIGTLMGTIPKGPTNTLLAGTIPSTTLPTGTTTTVPGTLPTTSLPSSTMTSGTLPGGILQMGSVPMGSQPVATTSLGPKPAGVSQMGTSKATPSMVPGLKQQQQQQQQQILIDSQFSVKDPLRELVLISETAKPTDTNYLSSVQQLANQARVIGEVGPATTPAAALPLSPPGQEMTTLSSIFQDPKDIVDPEKERAFYKQLEALEDTEDSDGFIERPVLGKISLIRRAKSAVSRSSSARTVPGDRYPLFSFAWEEQADVPVESSAVINEAYVEEKNTDEVIQIEPKEEAEAPADDNEEVVTVDDVKKKMTEFHLRSRSPTAVDRKATKSARPRRHKNKISPESTPEEEGSKGRRGKSAQESRSKKHKRIDSPPDPLEPWSTRELANINKILGS